MIYIRKEGLLDDLNQRIIQIRKSDLWKVIKENNTESIRQIFDNEFPKNEVKAGERRTRRIYRCETVLLWQEV